MASRITKIQYNTFEVGEFIDEKEKTYEETIAIIDNFPWEKQREHIEVHLSNASVTMENKNGEFLKFSLYYSGKYVLYFFNIHGQLFSKGFLRRQDAYPYIESFFDRISFEPIGFSKENTWMQDCRSHFVTHDFNYAITPKSALRYLLRTSGIPLSFTIFMTVLICLKPPPPGVIYVFLFIMCFLIGGGLNLILFFNYYLYARNKVLKMSKANDVFYFGNTDIPAAYNKQDIALITTYYSKGSRNPVSEFAFVKITFKDNTEIRIPNILLDESAITYKLYQCPHTSKSTFPTLDSN